MSNSKDYFSQMSKCSKYLFFSHKQENHDVLIKCLVEDKRFDKNRPVAPCIVYKALLQWGCFEAEKTHIFDRIIHAIRSSIEVKFLNLKSLNSAQSIRN